MRTRLTIAGLTLAHGADLVTTQVGLSAGLTEGNALAAAMINNMGLLAVGILKLCSVPLAWILIILTHKLVRSGLDQRVLTGLYLYLWIASTFIAFVALHNLLLILFRVG